MKVVFTEENTPASVRRLFEQLTLVQRVKPLRKQVWDALQKHGDPSDPDYPHRQGAALTRPKLEALDDPADANEIRAALEGAKRPKAMGEDLGVYLIDTEDGSRVVEWSGDDDDLYPDVSEPVDWIYSSNGDRATESIAATLNEKFEAEFAESPYTLYHATDHTNKDSILVDGLRVGNKTRGLTNTNVGDAVFTTGELDSALYGSYGDTVFEIDTRAMTRDGKKLKAELEPATLEQQARDAIASALEIEDFRQDSAMDAADDPNTVILYNSIPAKYLKVVHEPARR